MLQITDSRFASLNPFFKNCVFRQLTAATSTLELTQFPVVDEGFLDSAFTFRDLENSFAASVKPIRPPNIDTVAYSRACKAAELLVVCLTNGWGHPFYHDMQAALSTLIRQLSLAARHGSKLCALLYSLIDQPGITPVEDHNALPKLWMAWSMLKGCQTATRKLEANDSELHRKVLALTSIHHGPLHNRDDPAGFVQHLLASFASSAAIRDTGSIGELVTRRGNTILQFAIYCGDLQLVRDLVENGNCDINEKTMPLTDIDAAVGEGGETAIMLAARTGNQKIFRFLLEHGADLECTSNYNCNLLHSISWFPDVAAAEFAPELVRGGVKLAARAKEYLTRGVYNPFTHTHIHGSALLWAVVVGHNEFICTLINLHLQYEESVPDLDEILDHASSHFHDGTLAMLLEFHSGLSPSLELASSETMDRLLGLAIQNPMQFPLITLHGSRSVEAQESTVRLLLEQGARPLRGGYVSNLGDYEHEAN